MAKIISFNKISNLTRGRLPIQLIIQLTDYCHAKCPQCGMNTSNRFDRSRPDKDTVKKIIDTDAEERIDILSFTGGGIQDAGF